jgi:transmembrane protein 17
MISGVSAIHIEDSMSSLPLQQALYYNTIFSGVYLSFSVLHIIEKRQFVYNSVLHWMLYPPMVALWALGELCRLYCGYQGNLSEKVPETSAFLLVTIFPQMPCLVYLTFFQEHIWPLDRLFGLAQMALLFLELGIGFTALRALIRRQTAQFYRLCQEEG